MKFDLITDFDENYRGGDYGLPFMVRTFEIEVDGQRFGYIQQGEYIEMVQDGMPEISTRTRNSDFGEIEMYLYDFGFIDKGMFLNGVY